MSRERKCVWAWIFGLLIALPVLYVASFGPACWMIPRESVQVDDPELSAEVSVARFFRPLVRAAASNHRFVAPALKWYAGLATGDADLVPRMDWLLRIADRGDDAPGLHDNDPSPLRDEDDRRPLAAPAEWESGLPIIDRRDLFDFDKRMQRD